MIHQKLGIIRRLQSGKAEERYVASYPRWAINWLYKLLPLKNIKFNKYTQTIMD
jgi:hypothetical protein